MGGAYPGGQEFNFDCGEVRPSFSLFRNCKTLFWNAKIQISEAKQFKNIDFKLDKSKILFVQKD